MATKRKKRVLMEQETEKMLDVIAQMWPGQEEYMKCLMANRLSEHYGERWRDREHCMNCRATMWQSRYTINKVATRALVKYANVVRRRMTEGLSFTDANKIYLQGEATPGGSLSSTENDQKTILRYHGLVAKVRKEGKHDGAQWAITRWGWKYLRGEPISRTVSTWRGEIVERSQDMVTIRDVAQMDDYNESYYDLTVHDGEMI